MKRSAFSLVELSIVLVILGLLVGGILAGQSLIRASELRAVGTEQSRYRTAVLAFRDKYFALPGDMTNAISVWGKNNSYCPASPGTATTDGTCNGNGDGQIAGWNGSTWGNEVWYLWQHLALAGLIEGTYTGMYDVNVSRAGSNIPASKISNGAWISYNRDYTGIVVGTPMQRFSINLGNFFLIGATMPTNGPIGSLFTTTESWNLDTKLDDGKPGTGSIIMYSNDGNCSNATSGTDFNSSYALTITTPACALWFRNQF